MMDLNREPRVKWLTFLAALGLVHWFFGNLYEATVISPNWVLDSPAQLTRLNELFVRTSPMLYFVPITPVAALLVWLVTFLNRNTTLKTVYVRASVYTALAMALNAVIVSTLVAKLFGADYALHAARLHDYAVRWNILNVLRMALVGAAIAYLFSAFRELDRAAVRGSG
jgi:hypothetical protein